MSDVEKEAEFRSYLEGLDEAGLAKAYVAIMSIPDEATLTTMREQAMAGKTVEDMRQALIQALTMQMSISEEELTSYVEGMEEADLQEEAEQYLRAIGLTSEQLTALGQKLKSE
jgi:predicted transcriptional regulator